MRQQWHGSQTQSTGNSGYDIITELRIKQQYTEAQLRDHDKRLSDLERPRPRPMAVFKEWSPVILPAVVLIAALLGKLKWPEAFALIRSMSGGG